MSEEVKKFLECSSNYDVIDYITNLQQENEKLKEIEKEHKNCTRKHWQQKCAEHYVNEMIYKSRCEKAIEYITSYESISTIQGLDNIEQNKKLDKETINVMTNRYLKVHDKLLNILQGSDEK